MAGLPDDEPIPHIRARHQAQTAHQSGRAVGENIAVEIGRDDDVVGFRLAEEFVHHRVDDLFLDAEAGVLGLGERGAGGFAEEAVGLGEDVGFVGDCHEGAGGCALCAGGAEGLPAQRDVACHRGDAVGGVLGDAFDGFGDFGAVGGGVGAFFLDVEVFCVFADDDEVDGVGGGGGGFHGADVGVEVELFAEGDDGGGVAGYFCRGGGDGAEEGGVAFGFEGGDGARGEGGAGLLECFIAGGEGDEAEGEVEGRGEGFEDSSACLWELVSDDQLREREVLTGMTSRPIPSPGMRPIRNDLLAMGERKLWMFGFLAKTFRHVDVGQNGKTKLRPDRDEFGSVPSQGISVCSL